MSPTRIFIALFVMAAAASARADEPKVADSTQTSVLASSDSGVVFEADTDEGRVTAHVGMAWGQDDTLDLRLSTDIGSGSDTTLGNLDGLANGASLDLGSSWFWWPKRDQKGWDRACEQQALYCGATGLPPEEQEKRAAECEGWTPSSAGVPPSCDESWGSAAIRAALHDAAVGGPAWAFGLRAKASRQTFDYLEDVDSTDASSESRYSFSASGTFGAYVSGFGYAGVNVRWEHAYEGGASQNLCHGVGTMGTLTCTDQVIGAPTKSDELVVGAEWRGYANAHVGIGATVSYAVDRQVLGAQVPVYLLAGKDGLNGGVRFDFTGDIHSLEDGDIQTSVFVGDTFSVL